MAGLVSALTGTQKRVQFILNNKTVIEIDCSSSEKHSRESPPTEFPVEDGSSIGDDIILKPIKLEIQGVISDTPLSLLNSALATAVTKFVPPLGVVAAGAGAALFSALKKTNSPSVAAYLQLMELQEKKKKFDVVTTLKRYKDMRIASLSVPRDDKTGRALIFTVQLTNMIIVQPQTTDVLKYKDPSLAAGEANKGKHELEKKAVEEAKKGVRDGVGFVKGVEGAIGVGP